MVARPGPMSTPNPPGRLGEERADDLRRTFPRATVPQRDRSLWAPRRDERRDRLDPFRLDPEHGVRAELYGHRTLRRVAKGEAANAEGGGLLLYAPGIGDDERRLRFQPQEVEVAQ